MNGYEDMLLLPRHQSANRAHMTRLNRAAQFAPFAALSGYEGEILEAGRLTETAAELMEDELQRLDRALRRALERGEEVSVTYFVPDQRKAGGACCKIRGRIRRILAQEGVLQMNGGEKIPLERILEIAETEKQG